MSAPGRGRLTCVGIGMTLGAHLTPRAKASIESADTVFLLASDGFVEAWIAGMRPDVRSLQRHYETGRSRRAIYADMVSAVVDEVASGKSVCAAFYGHPGVFAQVAHDAIAIVRANGADASMQPGISAEDCLYADLGIDPGRYGCQHYEATQFLCTQRRLDTAAYLVLWQVATVGDRSFTRGETTREYRQLLVDRLIRDYPADHETILYEAATVALTEPRIERRSLGSLPDACIEPWTTLLLPPAQPLMLDQAMAQRLDALDTGRRVSVRPVLRLV